jgi:DNA-binding Xre family transcriptional regulator
MIVDSDVGHLLRCDIVITATIQEMARQREIQNASQLAREAQIHPVVAYRLWSGEFQRLDVDTLDRLCAALKCQPNQLLKYKA